MSSVQVPLAHIGVGMAALALASCAPPNPLRQALDTYSDETYSELADATGVVLYYIPKGTTLESAEALLRGAGFGPGRAFDQATADIVGHRWTADSYVNFHMFASNLLFTWTTYSVDLGVKDGLVEFLHAEIRVGSL